MLWVISIVRPVEHHLRPRDVGSHSVDVAVIQDKALRVNGKARPRRKRGLGLAASASFESSKILSNGFPSIE